MVVNKSFSGTALLALILVFAFLQMAVQIFFFLHLGRGPKPLYNVTFFIATIGLILVVVLGSIFIMNNLHYNMSSTDVTKKLAQDESIAQVGSEKTGACQTTGTNYKVTISKNTMSPVRVEARLCDTISFISGDGEAYDIAFGSDPQQDSYAGQEVSTSKNHPDTITLNQTGSYTFHDRLSPEAIGDFRVSN
jgi:plastocyanin